MKQIKKIIIIVPTLVLVLLTMPTKAKAETREVYEVVESPSPSPAEQSKQPGTDNTVENDDIPVILKDIRTELFIIMLAGCCIFGSTLVGEAFDR